MILINKALSSLICACYDAASLLPHFHGNNRQGFFIDIDRVETKMDKNVTIEDILI